MIKANFSDGNLKFNPNIGCPNCVKAASFFADGNRQNLEWPLDTVPPEVMLTVKGLQLSKQKVIRELNFAGFCIESIDDICKTKDSNI